MKSRFFHVAALCFVLVVTAGAGAPDTTRKADVVGTVVTNDSSTFVVAADLAGELPGYFTLSLRHEGNRLTEGTWLWVSKRLNPDGSVDELGMLGGAIVSATLTVTDAGTVASLADVKLKIDEGTGDFAEIGAGTGMLQGAIREDGRLSGEVTIVF